MLMTIRPRGDIAANWDKANPILKQRELAFEWETSIGVGKPRFKIGDGVTAWKDLPYSIDATGYWDELSEEDKKVLANTGSPDSIRLKTNNGTLEYNGEKAVFQKNDSGDGNTDCIIEGVANPTEDNQATNKKYVDDKTQTASDTIQGTVKASDQVIVNENGALEIGRLLDTYGIVNSSKTQQFVQDLIDNISNKVINDLISKNMISNVQVNSNSNIPSSSLVYGMNNQISELNANAYIKIKPYGTVDRNDGISVQDMVNQIISENSQGLFFFRYNSGSEGIPITQTSGTMILLLYNSSYYELVAFPFGNPAIFIKDKNSDWGRITSQANFNG